MRLLLPPRSSLTLARHAQYLNIFTDGPPPPPIQATRRASGPKPGVVVPRLVSTDWPFSTRPTAARELPTPPPAPAPSAASEYDSIHAHVVVSGPAVVSPRAVSYGSPLQTATEVSDNEGEGETAATPRVRTATLPLTQLAQIDSADESVDNSAGFATLLSLPVLSDPDLSTALHHLASSLEAYASVVASRRAGPHAASSTGLLLGRDGSLLGPGRAASSAPDALPVINPASVHPASLPPTAEYTPAQRLLFLAASPALDGAWGPLVTLVRALEGTLDDATERGVIAELRAEFMGASLMRGLNGVAPPNSLASVSVASVDGDVGTPAAPASAHNVVQYARVPSFPDIRQ